MWRLNEITFQQEPNFIVDEDERHIYFDIYTFSTVYLWQESMQLPHVWFHTKLVNTVSQSFDYCHFYIRIYREGWIKCRLYYIRLHYLPFFWSKGKNQRPILVSNTSIKNSNEIGSEQMSESLLRVMVRDRLYILELSS